MIDKKGFAKILDLNIPNMEYFDYYISQLAKTEKYKDIYEMISLYENAESVIDNLFDYRVDISNKIIEWLKSTNAYNEMCYDNTLLSLPTNKTSNFDCDKLYLSIDIRNANFSALKRYDPEHINELGDTYTDLLVKFNVTEIFHKSKYLRQYIFGNLNPKKQSLVQRNMIQNVVRKYSDVLDVEFVKNDEVIFSFKDFSEIKSIVCEQDTNKYKVKIFNNRLVEDFRIETIFDIDGNITSTELFGIDSSKYYMKYKEYISKEPLDIMDLYFRHNNSLAIWVVDGLKINIL